MVSPFYSATYTLESPSHFVCVVAAPESHDDFVGSGTDFVALGSTSDGTHTYLVNTKAVLTPPALDNPCKDFAVVPYGGKCRYFLR